MNKFNPKKLLNSKWTAVTPVNKARHFIVTELQQNETGKVVFCVLEAVMNQTIFELSPADLKERSTWIQGWC